MDISWKLLLTLLLSNIVMGKILFAEDFDTEEWKKTWVKSNWKNEKQAEFKHTEGTLAPKNFTKGLYTSQETKYYVLSRKFKPALNLSESPLVLQHSVKYEDSIVCGNGFIKLFPPDYNANECGFETPALVTFGPDVCSTNNRIAVLLNHNGLGEMWRKKVEAPVDKLTHFFTLMLKHDGSYQLYVDAEPVAEGSIESEWQVKAKEANWFNIGGIGIVIWQSKAKMLFDNILITDDLQQALRIAKEFINRYRQEEVEIEEREKRIKEGRDKEFDILRSESNNTHLLDL